MSDTQAGSIVWMDLTVPDADAVRDFYRDVVGWTSTDVSMGEYNDYGVNEPGSGKTVAGICHARGPNAGLPPVWLVYIQVEDLDVSMARCRERSGEVISGPRDMGAYGRMCVIRDPAGAVAALIQPPQA